MNKNQLSATSLTSLTDKILLLAIAGAGAFFISKQIKKYKEQKTMQAYGNDMNVQHAVSIANCLNPSGVTWLRNLDGTDEKGLYAIAEKITDFAAVSKAYQTLYNRNLIDDLRNELDATELSLFNEVLNKTKTSAQASMQSNAGSTHVTNSQLKPGMIIYAYFDNIQIFKYNWKNEPEKIVWKPQKNEKLGKITRLWKDINGQEWIDFQTDKYGNSVTFIVNTYNVKITMK